MKRIWTAIIGIVLCAGVAEGHHSFSAEFDSQQPVTVTGTVVHVSWTNPHARFEVEEKDAAGQVHVWDFELGSAAQLIRRGWTRSTLGIGTTVTVEGFRARRAPYVANAKTVTLADGKRVLAGSNPDGQ